MSYTLYHNLYSVCSLMVRYTFALRGEPTDKHHSIRIQEELIDIMAGEQLTEHFLCDVNANGEVPVLVNPDTKKPLPDSLDITFYLAESYPSLIPKQHEADVKRLLVELHQISYFALTFTGKPQMMEKNLSKLEQKLEGDVSERYRRAIEYKMNRIRSMKLAHLEPQSVEEAIDRTKKIMGDVETLLQHSQTQWIFGTESPTALDAHFVVFVARLNDVDRSNLVPDAVETYAQCAMEQAAFKETMEGRRTMAP